MVSIISLMGLFQQKSAQCVGRAADQDDQPHSNLRNAFVL